MRRVALPAPALVVLPLLALVCVSAYLRTRSLGDSLWIDEGISVGIASHPAADIPGLLRQDGSPPAYYLLLHGWIQLTGTGEAALRAPSLVFALLTVPAALWAGWSLFGRRAGWLCAVVAALLPFLTAQAQEARMYSLVALLSVLAAAAFLHAFVRARRGYAAVFALALTVLLYTHYWTLFLVLGTMAAFAVLLAGAQREDRRRLAVDGVVAFGIPALAFAPWVPTLVFHLEHTGAPWSNPPPALALVGAVALAAGAAVLPRLGRDDAERMALQALALAAAVTLAAGWASAHFEPGWASRYLAVLAGPLLLLTGAVLARIGPVGIVAAAALCAVWVFGLSSAEKSNVAGASAVVGARLEPGDLVVSTQPEQVPVLAHYLPDGLRYATPLGPVADPGVMDWRNALPRLEQTRSEQALAPLLDSLPAGRRVLLVAPAAEDPRRWQAPWTRLVVRRSEEWEDVLASDGRFRPLERAVPATETSRTSVRLILYSKTTAASSRGR